MALSWMALRRLRRDEELKELSIFVRFFKMKPCLFLGFLVVLSTFEA